MDRSSMRRFTIAAVAGVALGGFAVLSAESRPAQDAALALAGSWVINDELSDEPRARPGELGGTDSRRRGDPGGFGSGPGGFGGIGGGGGRFGRRGGERPDPAEMARMREAMQEAMGDLMTAARRMTIAGDADEVVLTYSDGRVVRLIPDGREHAGLAGTRARVTRTTRWSGDGLETEIELKSRPRFTVRQTYELQAAGDYGRQLIVTSNVKAGRRDRELRRVYDAVEP